MAEVIIDEFEVVEINHKTAEFGLFFTGCIEQSFELVSKGTTIQTSG